MDDDGWATACQGEKISKLADDVCYSEQEKKTNERCFLPTQALNGNETLEKGLVIYISISTYLDHIPDVHREGNANKWYQQVFGT
jgi:hypothetical protein